MAAALMLTIGGGVSTPAWNIQGTPNPAGATRTYLYSVACPSARSCTATGTSLTSSDVYVPLAEQWNGRNWAIEPTPVPPDATTATELNAVACSPRAGCTAVGFYWTGSDYLGLAERWNGSAWVIQPTPNPAGATTTFLTGVACPSATTCEAVGDYQDSTGAWFTLAERWNGTAWQIQPTPNPPGSTYNGLTGIACPSARNCTAVGQYTATTRLTNTLAEHWNGTTWTSQTTPSPPGINAQLESVACPTARTCSAAGFSASPGPFTPLAEHWNGRTWTTQAVPADGSGQSAFYHIACASARSCTAVGGYAPASGNQVTLAEHWNGMTWTVQTTPTPAGSAVSELDGLACSSATICTAVGSSYAPASAGGDATTLAERHS